ncbi:MAG: CmpA/NrtA family ABC transporter substrate-binding protein [Litoreibacter sp.]|nr:CmpA/NrtA family ABC transporter substrate-binding protein [Litoreibacter sp.]MCY4333143.1 CmpA/NrtA family ABC transporter substrate-binding protein [Litoreibacter sp.]
MSGERLNCGYVPLVDCAPLIIAHELGFAAQNGLALNLLKQPSWAALRDLLALGHLDAAHMLSPMPIAMTLGLSGPQVDVIAPLVISANGTVFGVSPGLAQEMGCSGWESFDLAPGRVLAFFASVDKPLRLGVPFPYSMHRLLFEYLVAGLSQTQRDLISIVPFPPPLMADAVAAGEIDLFVVGEPWGTVAVGTGAAEIVLPGSGIWAHAPEKVLGMRRDWVEANESRAEALTRAVFEACEWLGVARNHPLACEILARSEHLNLPDAAIEAALSGRITPRLGATPWFVPNFLQFGGAAASFPWRSSAAWIGGQLCKLEGLDANKVLPRAAACFRPDLYRRFLAQTDADMPGASAKIEGSLSHPTAVASTRGEMILEADAFFDGKTFDFSEIF